MENVYYNKSILDLPLEEALNYKQVTIINSFNGYQKIECYRLIKEYTGKHLYTFSYSSINSFSSLSCRSQEIHMYVDGDNKFIIDNLNYYMEPKTVVLDKNEKYIKFKTKDEMIRIMINFDCNSFIKKIGVICYIKIIIQNLENEESSYYIGYFDGIDKFIEYLLSKCEDKDLVNNFKDSCNIFKIDLSKEENYGNYSKILKDNFNINFGQLTKKIDFKNGVHFYLPIIKISRDNKKFQPKMYNKNNEIIQYVYSKEEALIIDYVYNYFVKNNLSSVNPITFNFDKRTCKLLYESKTGIIVLKNGLKRFFLKYDKYIYQTKDLKDCEILENEYNMFERLTKE